MTEEPSPLSTVHPDSIISYPRTNAQTSMACKGAQPKLLSSPSAKSSLENCNPNVSHGSCKRKISKSSATDQFPENNNVTPKPLSGQAYAEFNLISPPRKHACSSRRCASKNPDYAVPATANPKKLSVSKRHVLPRHAATLCKCYLRENKGEVTAVDEQTGSMKPCNRCSHESHLRRWSADESGARFLTADGKSTAFSVSSSEPHGKDALDSSDSGQSCAFTQAFMNAAVGLPVAETALQENAIDRFKCWRRAENDLSNLQAQQEDTQDNHLKTENIVGDITSQMDLAQAEFSRNEPEVQRWSSGPGRKRRSYDTSCIDQISATGDDGCPQLMPDEEDSAGVSPSPEKSGNWRLNAVLQAFESLSPTREGRVKTLVKAFESLMSFTEGKGDQQKRKPRGYPLQFSYLSSKENLQAGEKSGFAEGGAGGRDKEGVRDEEEEGHEQWHKIGTWQGVEDEEDGDWQKHHAEGEYTGAIVEDKERNRMGDLWKNHEVEEMFDQSNEKGFDSTEEKVLQKQESHRIYAQAASHENNQHVKQLAERTYAQRVDEHEEEKETQEHARGNVSKGSLEGHEDDEVGKQHDEQPAGQVSAQTAEEDEERKLPKEHAEGNTGSFEGDKDGGLGKQHDEQPAERVYSQTAEEDEDGKQPQEQAVGNRSAGSFEEGSVYEESEEDDQSKELEGGLDKLAAFERRPPDQEMCVDMQRHVLQKSMDGYFASTAARKNSSSRNRKHSQVSNRSVSSIRLPLAQKSQTQLQDKPRFSKPQPFKLLTEERGHMKEQEFLMRLRRIMEEEEKLRVPLAQGLPWTTDEPEVPYKPPVKENTKPLDVHLNSDLRAMERAEFDRFIAEKLLYIEERRLEEERLRRIAEEEEIKRMRQEMVPKAQLMPYFDRPFRPIRSSKRPTIPKEPQFQHKQLQKRQKCVASST